MKAAVMTGLELQYTDVPEPIPQNDEILVDVKAVALKNLDRSRAKGTHYTTENNKAEATIIGSDGVCLLPDGTRVYAVGTGGMAAGKALVRKDMTVRVPDTLDNRTAAALPNAVFGSAMALRFRAGIAPGETVLINGATGVTGRIAVQVAKHYGAGTIIATGRNPRSLNELRALGADRVLSLQEDDLDEQLLRIQQSTPIHVVIDYLWGPTAEQILASLKGDGSFTQRTRFVSVGAMSGEFIRLSAATLRSADLQLMGSGLGSWTRDQIKVLFSDILPGMFQLAASGKLTIDTVPIALQEIERVWDAGATDGKRLVIEI
jgi:NADPH:quinone reductase-like Zn-dependent oxidoreductase